MLTLDTYRKAQILGHNIVIYSCISNLTLTVILHQNVKKNLRSYLRCSDMYVKAAHTMDFYSKTGPNLLDVFMTNYPSIYHESVVSIILAKEN